MNQEFSIVCETHLEITNLIPFITQWYNTGKYVHFLNVEHKNLNCFLMGNNYIVIFIPVELKQAAKIIINEYNNHFHVNEDDEDDDNDVDDDNDEDDGDEEDDDETKIDPIIAFTCPACSVLTL